MNSTVQKIVVRTLLRCTSRKRSFQHTETILQSYLEMVRLLTEDQDVCQYGCH